jgi:hypothetical protein
MFDKVDIKTGLIKLRDKNRNEGDELIKETKRILNNDLFAEKKILENLTKYSKSFLLLDEEDIDANLIFTEGDIKKMAVTYRLKLLDSKLYKTEIPYEAVLRIKYLNGTYGKDLREFRILTTAESFAKKESKDNAVLFAKTNHDNYYIVHRWGHELKWSRKLRYWPLRSLETLVLTIMIFTLVITMSLPTALISLDPRITYWSGFRLAAYFHLLIFFSGFTAFYAFAFTKNFSSSVWNKQNDFG